MGCERETGAAGFTLVELMGVCVLLSLVTVTIGNMTVATLRHRRAASGYLEDITESRRVLSALDADLRCGQRVTAGANGFRIHLDPVHASAEPSAGHSIDYQVVEGVVTRTHLGRTRTLARCIASLTAVQDGKLVAVRLQIRGRRKGQRSAHAGVLHTAVCLEGVRP